MNKKISEILDHLSENGIKYDFSGDKSISISGFSDPSEYRRGTAIWLGNPGLFNCDCCPSNDVSLLLIKKNDYEYSKFPNRLALEDPRNVFNGLVEYYFPIEYQSGIEKSAIISASSVIGKNCYIGHNSFIDDNVVIGDNTVIQNNVSLRAGVHVGSDCFIGDSTSIGNAGFGFRMTDKHEMYRLPHLGSVEIGNKVEIGSNVCICRGTFKDTRISDGVKIDSNTYIGHNVSVGANTLIINSQIDGNSSIGSGSTVVNSDVVNRVHIGDEVFVGIGSVVVSDIPDRVRVFGVPARIVSNTNEGKETKYSIEKEQLATEERKQEHTELVGNIDNSNVQEKDEVMHDVIETVASTLEVSYKLFSIDTKNTDLAEWDSLAQLKITVAIENKFHVEIPIDKAVSLTSIEMIVKYIREN